MQLVCLFSYYILLFIFIFFFFFADFECIASYAPMPVTIHTGQEDLYQRKPTKHVGGDINGHVNGGQQPNSIRRLSERLRELQSERKELGNNRYCDIKSIIM